MVKWASIAIPVGILALCVVLFLKSNRNVVDGVVLSKPWLTVFKTLTVIAFGCLVLAYVLDARKPKK
jgi:hypothetical protein